MFSLKSWMNLSDPPWKHFADLFRVLHLSVQIILVINVVLTHHTFLCGQWEGRWGQDRHHHCLNTFCAAGPGHGSTDRWRTGELLRCTVSSLRRFMALRRPALGDSQNYGLCFGCQVASVLPVTLRC